MKKKLRLPLLVAAALAITAAARAQDSLKLLFGTKTVHTALLANGEPAATCTIPKRLLAGRFSTVTVRLVLQQANTVYKNQIRLVYTGRNGEEAAVAAGLVNSKAVFMAATVKKLLQNRREVTVQLVQEPANPMMSLPTRMRNLIVIKTR